MRKNTVAVVERVLAERLRTVVMLAGAGLDAATALADAGWVCVGSSSLRALPNSPSAPDAAVRILEDGDLRSARQLAEDVFGIDRESATLVYQEAAPDRPSERSVVGLFELDTLQTAAMLSFGKPSALCGRPEPGRKDSGADMGYGSFGKCRQPHSRLSATARVWSRQRCRQCSVRRERSRNRRVLADVVATAMVLGS